jgi:hypothetical protein
MRWVRNACDDLARLGPLRLHCCTDGQPPRVKALLSFSGEPNLSVERDSTRTVPGVIPALNLLGLAMTCSGVRSWRPLEFGSTVTSCFLVPSTMESVYVHFSVLDNHLNPVQDTARGFMWSSNGHVHFLLNYLPFWVD